MKNQITKVIRDAMLEDFRYLVEDFGCRLTDKDLDSAYCKLAYKNETTGVVITYDLREQYVDVHLYKLRDGQIVPNLTRALLSSEEINGFSLGYIVKTQNPTEMLLPLYRYEQDSIYLSDDGLVKYIKACAIQLRQYGFHILKGDFTSFGDLEKSFRMDYLKNR